MGKIKSFISNTFRFGYEIKLNHDIDDMIKESLKNRLNTIIDVSKKIKKEFNHGIKLVRKKYAANINKTIEIIKLQNVFKSTIRSIEDICDYIDTYTYITVDDMVTQLDAVEKLCFDLDDLVEELQKYGGKENEI